jgi:hypothetical protein
MIDLAIFVRPDIFATLKIETQQHRDAGIAGPKYPAIGV